MGCTEPLRTARIIMAPGLPKPVLTISSRGKTRQNKKRPVRAGGRPALTDALTASEGKRKVRLTADFAFTLCITLCMICPMPAHPNPLETVESSDQSRPARPGPGVAGVVRAASGKPVSGVAVVAQSLDKPSPAIPDIAITTDAAGRYLWLLRPGNYELTFLLNGKKLATRRVTISAESTPQSLDVVAGQ
jgi:hypothetical protein